MEEEIWVTQEEEILEEISEQIIEEIVEEIVEEIADAQNNQVTVVEVL